MSDDSTILPGSTGARENPDTLAGDTVVLQSGADAENTSFASTLEGPAAHYSEGDVVDGKYKLTAVLGRGGMGVVFACKHLIMGNNSAIKLLSAEGLTDEHWSRFQTEVKALAKLNHPCIIAVYDMGIDAGVCPYYVMERLPGESLDSLIKSKGPLPVDLALNLFIQVADALSSAHAQGIVHRDIKPSNLMILPDQNKQTAKIKIVDFGIARLSTQGKNTQSQTATGLIIGTPIYMSPEQCQGQRVDHRSDIYSFGCTLFEALTGSPPLRGENSFQTYMMHQNTRAPLLSQTAGQGKFPPALELAVDKMLRKSADHRYQTMNQVRQDLERIRAGKEILDKRPAAVSKDGVDGEVAPISRTVPTPVPPKGSSSGKATGWSLSKKVLVTAMVPVAILTLALLDKTKRQHRPLPVKKMPATEIPSFFNTSSNQPAAFVDANKFRMEDYSEADIKQAQNYNFEDGGLDRGADEDLFDRYFNEMQRKGYRFLNKQGTVLNFPVKFVIGAVGIGQQKPVLAIGSVDVPKGNSICFYQSSALMTKPYFLLFFGPEDLDGIQLILEKPAVAISIVQKWKKLTLLSFFNPLIKTIPGLDRYDHSNLTDNDLPKLEAFPHLKTLGLCGEHVTGRHVANMPLIAKITSLRLQGICDIDNLLAVLPRLNNLKEVWLLCQGITDKQLEPLTKMQNLETLRIRRCHLTKNSIALFKKMRSLRHLYLDCNWTKAEKAEFRANIGCCQFEPKIDETYWKYLGDKTKNEDYEISPGKSGASNQYASP